MMEPTGGPEMASAVNPQTADQQTVPHKEKAWEFFRSMGSPKFHVAPMVDQSELPFRRLCRKYGATCAYTPMFHARLFCEDAKYRSEIFTTCEGDKPLLVQFCANDPNYLVRAANIAAPHADAIDINFGCPQRIAKRGNYGSFLMDDLPLVERLVTSLVQGVPIPVTCKIRVFPKVEDTIAYAKMIERCGCSVLAVHGRTREQKDLTATRADWDQIKAVKQALQIPVLGNGNIRTLQDAYDLMSYTGVDGVLSAESLLEDPELFSPGRLLPGGAHKSLDRIRHCIEYLEMCEETPTHLRMVRGHVHKLVGPWLSEYTDLRDQINNGRELGGLAGYLRVVRELDTRVRASGREEPIPVIPERVLKRLAMEAAKKAAIEEQEREAAALSALQGTNTAPANGTAQPSQPALQPANTATPSQPSAPAIPADAAPQGNGDAAHTTGVTAHPSQGDAAVGQTEGGSAQQGADVVGNGVSHEADAVHPRDDADDESGVAKKRKGEQGAVDVSAADQQPVACVECM